jgi:hypothetical protein
MRSTDVIPVRHAHRHAAVSRAERADFGGVAAAVDPLARLRFSELYATTGIIGLRLSEKARDLAGRAVVITGYMAPPLDTRAGFFVLTRAPTPTCPFCDPLVSWPDDLVLSLQGDSGGAFADPDLSVEVSGILDIGRKADPRTGAVRLVRLLDAAWRAVPAKPPSA